MARYVYDEAKEILLMEGYNAANWCIFQCMAITASEKYNAVAPGLVPEEKMDEFRDSVVNAVKYEIDKERFAREFRMKMKVRRYKIELKDIEAD